jgi:hypothetical protein
MRAAVQHAGSLTLRAVEARTLARLIDAPGTALDGAAWLASEPAPGSRPRTLAALPDGNRGAIVLEHEVPFLGRSWRLAVKGVGARAPLYGDTPAGYAHAHELTGALDPAERSLLHAITRESWMGEAPYGGQGLENASHALALSSPALRDALAPCVLCPVLAVVEVPEDEVLDVFHYRRHRGPVVQEHRLVPSTVRLFHQSALALGKDCEGALAALGVESVEALDLFIDRYLASALALLTVGARSVRARSAGTFELLDYDDAWLDKDAFVAPDGSLAFADLEALVYVEVHDEAALGARIRRQVERNAYEALYGVDALLRAEERWRDRPRDQRARREALAERTALAVAHDPALALVAGPEGWDLEVRPQLGPELRARWLDAR